MKNALVTEAYISGATKMEPAIIEGAGEMLSLALSISVLVPIMPCFSSVEVNPSRGETRFLYGK